MLRYVLLLGAALSLGGCDNGDTTVGLGGGSAYSKVNGTVKVPAGEHAGAVGTVNGTVQVGENAVVGSVHSVNGEIELAAHASADSISAVNGEVTLADGARVAGGITTVNGSIELKGADVAGMVKNVNGHMVLEGAHVAGGLHTIAGDIDISGSSRVEGGILVKKETGWFNNDRRKPRIIIGPGAVVSGELRFEREVDLYVSDQATVGAITGATPVHFSGDKPPA